MTSELLLPFLTLALLAALTPARAETIFVGTRDLQQVIDAAPPHALVQCDPNQTLVVSAPIIIRRPLTLVGLHARLPAKLGRTKLLVIESPGVTVLDFDLTGNAGTVPQDQRAPLMAIYAGDFRIERGRFSNSSKDGVMITSGPDKQDVVGGVVRDIVGRNVKRDTVSIGGGDDGARIRNVLVDNVRAYGSELRGAVEVSDGSDNITVRKVYAEGCSYAIDVQDHKKPGQINRNIVIEDVYAVRCKQGIVTNNRRLGHLNLTIRDVTVQDCAVALRLSHTDNLQLSNIRILGEGGQGGLALTREQQDAPLLHLLDCRGVTVRDVVVENTTRRAPALLLEDCNEVLVDGVRVQGAKTQLAHAVSYRVTTPETFSGLRIANVVARNLAGAGIALERVGKKPGALTDYRIVGNLATVEDNIKGARAVVADNLATP